MVEQRNSDDTMRWVRRGSVLAVLLIGWIFILVTNHFRITPPTVFACLGYFAGVIAIYTLFRTGATAVTDTDESDDALSWTQPLGALDEREREKRALLKAIKEAEFDQEMWQALEVGRREHDRPLSQPRDRDHQALEVGPHRARPLGPR